MYLVKNSQPCGVIKIEPSAQEPVSFAAAELQRYIQQATGAFMPVCSEPRKDVALYVGIDTRLADEEFEIVSKGGRVEVFGGNGLGALYGAYHLLKRHCGMIFAGYGPEGEHVPHLTSIEVPEGTERRKPLLWYRGSQLTSVGEIGDQMSTFREGAIRRIDWMAKNGMNYVLTWPAEEGGTIRSRSFTWKSDTECECHIHDQPNWSTPDWINQNLLPEIRKRGLKIEQGHHNMSLFLPPAVYFDKHPEYYAMRDGKRSPKRCQLMICTSNQEAVEEYTSNILRYLEANPQLDIIGLLPEDDFGMCECDQCRKLDDPRYEGEGRKLGTTFMNGRSWRYSEHQNKTRRYIQLVNFAARRIKERFPRVKVNACAYIDMAWPPADTELEDNVILFAAVFIRCGAHRYDDPTCEMNTGLYDLVKTWTKKAPGRVYLYEYYMGKSSYRSLPYPIAHRIAQDWQLFAPLGIIGMTGQDFVTGNEAYVFNAYTFARRAWNLEEPFERILDDFLTGRFGSKAQNIKPIYQQWMDRMDQFGKEGQCFNAGDEKYYVPEDHEPPKQRQGRCYHPDGNLFLAIYDAGMVRQAMATLDKALSESCTPRERVQLDRFRISLEFIERFRQVHEQMTEVRKDKQVGCDRGTCEKVLEFLDWEKQYVDMGYFSLSNDSYQWKNCVRGIL